MNRNNCRLTGALAMLALGTFNLQLATARAQTAAAPAAQQPPLPAHAAAIPCDQIGAVAGKQYSGDGLAAESSPEGARLRCVFQRLNARVTHEGLWLVSTRDGARGEPFRVVARAVGRQEGGRASPRTLTSSAVPEMFGLAGTLALPEAGKVEVTDNRVRFLRPGLTEEYTVSMDGVRQDFVIERRPPGQGALRLELEVDGAQVQALGDGAQLVLADGGRRMAYNRLKAEDARGRPLKARMEALWASRLAVVLEDATAEYPVRIDPTFSDANWISLGGVPGVGGVVRAVAVDTAGNLYVGGDFSAAANVVANDIAKWNGSSWSALGSGLNGSYGVRALAVSGNTLYAGGGFHTAGGVSATNIAQWNGSSWSALGSGLNGEVEALAVSGTTLYAGGSFTNAGSVSANYIAQWNGSSWSALGSGLNGEVEALAASGTTLYAGGSFTNAGSVSANYIAQWNGSSWSALGSGLLFSGYPPVTSVNALAVSGTTLYAGGEFDTAGGVSANCIAQWNGSSWSALGSGLDNIVCALAVSGTNLYAGGYFASRIAQWNGSSWSALVGPGMQCGVPGLESGVVALAVSGNTLYAGGAFTSAGGVSANYIARWNGSSWSALGSGMNCYVAALAVSGTKLYAGGYFTSAGGVSANYIAQWNGSSWSALGSGITGVATQGDGPYLTALAVSGTNLYAAGHFGSAGGVSASYIAQWNGSSWSALGSGMNLYGYVNALAVSGTNLYAGGAFTSAGGVSANYIAQWNGSSWSALGSGMNSYVCALAVSGTNLYAGGEFTSAGGVSAHYIAQWNGSSWSALGSGTGGSEYPYVCALAVSGTNLYAGGAFTSAGGVSANYIARWNGSSWSGLGSGMYGNVSALAVSGTNLYAGGEFYWAGGVSANCIAQWNGSSWSALGSGMNYEGDVSALAVSGNILYAGGSFTTAGTNVSGYVAEALLSIPPPSLQCVVFPQNGQRTVDVSWPSNALGSFTLQASTNLLNWTNVSSAPIWSNALFQVTLPATNHPSFFRLKL